MKNRSFRSGFTLIELVLVIGVIAILSAIAIGKFADIRKDSARKANIANIKNITRTVNTKLAMAEGESHRGLFAYAESLIDCARGGGAPRGTEGTYEWAPAQGWYDAQGGVVPGIYCGIKVSEVVANASGQTTGQIASLGTAHEKNVGLGAFASKLGLYYLTAKEVAALKEAGVSILSYHNYSNAQATELGWSSSVWATDSSWGLHATGGGPGHRPDLSACYPVVLTNGMPVAVLNPATSASVWRDLGLSYASTVGVTGLSATSPETYFQKGVCTRLVVVGMGRDCELGTTLFENLPRCMTLDKTCYRNYLLVFSMAAGGGNSGNAVSFVGVIDPQGNTAKQAQYTADWAS